MALVLLFALAGAETAPAPSDLAALLPAADTILLARFPSLGEAWRGFRSLPLYRAYRDEEVQEFIASSFRRVVEREAQAEGLVGSLLALPDAFGGEVAFALWGRAKDPQAILSLASTGDPEAARGSAEKIVVPILRRASFGEPERKRIGGAEILAFAGPGETMALGFDGKRVLFAPREEALAEVLGRRGSPAGSLAEDATYRRALGRAGGDPSLFFFANLAKVWEESLRDAGEGERKAMERSGLAGIRAVSAVLRMAEGRAADAIWFDVPEGPAGFLRGLAAAPLEFGTLRLVPRESFAYLAGNFRPAELYRAALAVAEVGSGGMLGELARADRDLAKGFGLRSLSDVVGLLGTEIGICASFPSGGAIFPEAVAAIEVLEPDRLLERLDALVRTASGREPSVLRFQGREIRYLADEADAPFSLCWCVTDGWLLLSYHPTMIKGAIRRLDGKGETLRDDPAFAAARKGLPEGSTAAVFFHTERLFRFLYGIAIPVAGMMGTRLSFNAAELPSADAIARHLSFGLSGIAVERDGISIRTESDGYGPTSLGLYGTIGLLALHSPLPSRDELLTAPPRCGENLRRIHEALQEVRRDRGRYPASLAEIGAAQNDRWMLWTARCPAVERERPFDEPHWEDFGYLLEGRADPPDSLPDDAILIWDAAPRHNGGRIVLHAGGKLSWMREAEFRELREGGKP